MGLWQRLGQMTLIAAGFVGRADFASAQGLDQTCTASVNGQTVKVNPDGTFQVSNISAGPDLVRVEVVCQKNGQTLYGQSEFFEIKQNQTFSIGDVVLLPSPAVKVVGLSAIANPPTLTQSGQISQVTVLATLTNGLTDDVTGPPELKGTTYTSSNTKVASVDSLGVVAAAGNGSAFITARCQGATATASLTVSLGDPLTTASGVVVLNDAPVDGAMVTVVGQGLSGNSQVDGAFSISGAVSMLGAITVSATKVISGTTYFGKSTLASPTPGGVTDVGIIVLKPAPRLLIIGSDPNKANFPVPQLSATGLFSSVAIFNAYSGTPTRDFLQLHDVVLAYTDNTPQNAIALGDVLADYVDSGHGLVLSTYAFSTPWSIRGKVTQSGYSPLLDSGSNGLVGPQLVPQIPGDPIFDGIAVGSIGYFQNVNFAHPTLAPGAVLVATSNLGFNMIARNAQKPIIAMNLFPSTYAVGNNTALYQLFANALLSAAVVAGG